MGSCRLRPRKDATLRGLSVNNCGIDTSGRVSEVDPVFSDVKVTMDNYGLYLSRRKTGILVVVGCSRDGSYGVSLTRPPGTEFWERIETPHHNEAIRIIHDYIEKT